jgi:hypothetical protein
MKLSASSNGKVARRCLIRRFLLDPLVIVGRGSQQTYRDKRCNINLRVNTNWMRTIGYAWGTNSPGSLTKEQQMTGVIEDG